MKATEKNATLRRSRVILSVVLLVVLTAIVWIYVRPYVPYKKALKENYRDAYLMRFDYARDGNTYYANVKASDGSIIMVPCTSSDDWIILGEQDIRDGKDTEIAKFVAGYKLMLLPTEKREAVKAIGHEVFCNDTYDHDMKRNLKEDMAIAILH